jgi:hypothetical protein
MPPSNFCLLGSVLSHQMVLLRSVMEKFSLISWGGSLVIRKFYPFHKTVHSKHWKGK